METRKPAHFKIIALVAAVYPPDTELIARVIQDDDRHAFEQLVRRYQSQLRSFLRRLTHGNTSLSDDLAQDTLIRAYRGIRKYRGGSKFSSWLYRIAYNVFLSHLKKNARHQEGDIDLCDIQDKCLAQSVNFRHDLSRALSVLSEKEQATLALAYGNETSHEDISEILDVPLGTVKTNILRAKEKLRTQLRAWRQEEIS